MRLGPALFFVFLVFALFACGSSKKKTCKVNDQCFVCPDDKAVASCFRDPTSSRCKWAPMSTCQ